MSDYTPYQWDSVRRERERAERQRKEQEQRDIDDIDAEINWAYSEMRIIEARLEATIERAAEQLSDHEQKRIDKALVVTRTGLKMLKKVVKLRAPHFDTSAWKRISEAAGDTVLSPHPQPRTPSR